MALIKSAFHPGEGHVDGLGYLITNFLCNDINISPYSTT